MRKKILIFIFLATFGNTAISQTSENAPSDNEACGMVICLSTPNKNAGGVACMMAIQQFVKIKVKKAGLIDPIRTIKKRHDKLNACKGARRSDTELIMAQYGLLM